MTAPVSSSMAAVLARVSSLEVSFGLRRPAATTAPSSAPDFDSLLQGAMGTERVAAAGLGSGPTASGGGIVDTARRYLGIPYLWGGTNPEVGLDCSGFVLNVFGDLGVHARSAVGVASLPLDATVEVEVVAEVLG